jgi:2-(1,2-epoxy-1,2-dihydrophenyl)acetyl-CoA isomerase
MSATDSVIYSVEDSVAWLRLNRPDQMNAMTNGLMQGISAGVLKVQEDPSVRALVITGQGRGFCAGADLNQVADGSSPAESAGKPTADAGADYFNKALADLKNCPVPTIARVNGPAAGGGLGLALVCDITIAAHSAFFVATFGPNLGIVPDMGTTWNLPRRIGRARSLSMALLGERVSAAQAEEWGLIWRAVPDEDLDEETAKAVAILKNSSPDASVRIRETVDAAMDNSFERQLELEMEHQAVLIPKNMKAGAKAFLEKRKPTFDGSRKG